MPSKIQFGAYGSAWDQAGQQSRQGKKLLYDSWSYTSLWVTDIEAGSVYRCAGQQKNRSQQGQQVTQHIINTTCDSCYYRSQPQAATFCCGEDLTDMGQAGQQRLSVAKQLSRQPTAR